MWKLQKDLKTKIAKFKKEAQLIDTLDVVERRALMELNKNPGGLTLLAENPLAAAAFQADKSALFKFFMYWNVIF